jgi:hypothetical protein
MSKSFYHFYDHPKMDGFHLRKKDNHSKKKLVVFFKEMFFLQQMGCVPPRNYLFLGASVLNYTRK